MDDPPALAARAARGTRAMYEADAPGRTGTSLGAPSTRPHDREPRERARITSRRRKSNKEFRGTTCPRLVEHEGDTGSRSSSVRSAQEIPRLAGFSAQLHPHE